MRAGKYPWPEGEPVRIDPPATHERIERACGLREAWARREAEASVALDGETQCIGPVTVREEGAGWAKTPPDAPLPGPNHPLVRVRRHHQAITLEVSDCSVDLSPSEALRLIRDLEELTVVLGWLEPRG